MSDAEKDIVECLRMVTSSYLYAGEQTILRHKAADTIATLRAERDAAIARAEKAEAAPEENRRDIAIAIVDMVHGYTCEFSSDQKAHERQYEVAEEIFDDIFKALASLTEGERHERDSFGGRHHVGQ